MKLEIIYAKTPDELDKKVEAKLSKGWVKTGIVARFHPPPVKNEKSDFIYYVQTLIKNKISTLGVYFLLQMMFEFNLALF